MRLAVAIAGMVLALGTGSALAEVYKYTDSKGEIHFVDDVAKVPKKYRKQLVNPQPLREVSVMDAAPVAKRRVAEEAAPPRQEKPAVSAGVEVYMTSWCGYCKKMVRFLNEKGIPYTAYDIEKDSAAARTYRELGGSGVPVVRVGSHVVHGYSPEAVMSYLNAGK
jgi:glutaredoxin